MNFRQWLLENLKTRGMKTITIKIILLKAKLIAHSRMHKWGLLEKKFNKSLYVNSEDKLLAKNDTCFSFISNNIFVSKYLHYDIK